MPDIVDQLRQYGEAVEALATRSGRDASVDTVGPRRRRPLVGASVVAGLIALLAAGAILLSNAGQSDTVATDTGPGKTTTSAPAASVPVFEAQEFVSSKLGGAGFDDDTGPVVGMVVLVPASEADSTESLINSTALPELEGYTFVPAAVVSQAADQFAAAAGTGPLEGDWVAYGLIPQYADSPVAEWAEALGELSPATVVAVVETSIVGARRPEGWEPIADFSFEVPGGALVTALADQVVVVESSSTWVISLRGDVQSVAGPPLEVATECCGGTTALPAGESLVLVEEESTATWIFDLDTLAWRLVDDRPDLGFVLGSAFVGNRLLVVNSAARTGDATSSVAELDPASGSWSVLDPVPQPISVGDVSASDGGRLIVGGTRQGPNNNIIGSSQPLAYELSDDGWIEHPAPPISGQASSVAAIGDDGLLAWNYDLEAATYDATTEQWTSIESVPMAPGECYPRSIRVLDGIVAQCGGLAWFDTQAAQWEPIILPSQARFAVVGDTFVALMTVDRESTTMLSLALPPAD